LLDRCVEGIHVDMDDLARRPVVHARRLPSPLSVR
jgi:hypothetical protein